MSKSKKRYNSKINKKKKSLVVRDSMTNNLSKEFDILIEKNGYPKSNHLVRSLYIFLKSTPVQTEVKKLLRNPDPLNLYKSLREDTETQKGKRYILSLTPSDDELWKLCQKNFLMEEGIYEFDWPAGDWKNYRDATSDALSSWIYDYSRTKKYPSMNNPEETGTSLQYSACIYINFVIPYVMSKYSIENQNVDAPINMFTFVHYGGGAGALVKTDKGHKAYSCGHTLYYDNKDMGTDLGGREYLIMLSDGTLAIIGKAVVYFDEDEGIDAGIAEVVHPKLTKKYFGDIKSLSGINIPKAGRGRRAQHHPNSKIVSWGSPSLIPIKKNPESSYKCENVNIPNTNMEVCWWEPLYFYKREGNIEGPWNADDDENYHTIQHDALVWEGMSGGPITDEYGNLIAFHHRGDGMAMRADNMHKLLG